MQKSETVDTSTVREKPTTSARKTDKEYYCNGHDLVVCPICRGSGVIIESKPFGDTYKECPYSDEHGRMPCEHYIEYIKKDKLIEYDPSQR